MICYDRTLAVNLGADFFFVLFFFFFFCFLTVGFQVSISDQTGPLPDRTPTSIITNLPNIYF